MLPLKKYKGKDLFKKTKEEREALKAKQKEKSKHRKMKRIARMKKNLKELEDQIQISAPNINTLIQNSNKQIPFVDQNLNQTVNQNNLQLIPKILVLKKRNNYILN